MLTIKTSDFSLLRTDQMIAKRTKKIELVTIYEDRNVAKN